jgi:hypothetical protein
MATQVTATVISGVLKPDAELGLADNTRVHLTIEPLDDRLQSAEA